MYYYYYYYYYYYWRADADCWRARFWFGGPMTEPVAWPSRRDTLVVGVMTDLSVIAALKGKQAAVRQEQYPIPNYVQRETRDTL